MYIQRRTSLLKRIEKKSPSLFLYAELKPVRKKREKRSIEREYRDATGKPRLLSHLKNDTDLLNFPSLNWFVRLSVKEETRRKKERKDERKKKERRLGQW